MRQSHLPAFSGLCRILSAPNIGITPRTLSKKPEIHHPPRLQMPCSVSCPAEPQLRRGIHAYLSDALIISIQWIPHSRTKVIYNASGYIHRQNCRERLTWKTEKSDDLPLCRPPPSPQSCQPVLIGF